MRFRRLPLLALALACCLPAAPAAAQDPDQPSVTITSGPSGEVAETTATFTYQWSGPVEQVVCKLDDGPEEPCAEGSRTYSNLAPGGHRFVVRAIGASRDATAWRGWFVRQPPPPPPPPGGRGGDTEEGEITDEAPERDDVAITRISDLDAFGRRRVVFSKGRSGRPASCAIDDGAFRRCTSPFVVDSGTLRAGRHVFRVRVCSGGTCDRDRKSFTTPARHLSVRTGSSTVGAALTVAEPGTTSVRLPLGDVELLESAMSNEGGARVSIWRNAKGAPRRYGLELRRSGDGWTVRAEDGIADVAITRDASGVVVKLSGLPVGTARVLLELPRRPPAG